MTEASLSRALFFASAVRDYDRTSEGRGKTVAIPAGVSQRDWAAMLNLFRPALKEANTILNLNRKL
jgi:hypothetical protein